MSKHLLVRLLVVLLAGVGLVACAPAGQEPPAPPDTGQGPAPAGDGDAGAPVDAPAGGTLAEPLATAAPAGEALTAGWVTYTDTTHAFSVAHPPNFVVSTASAERLAGLLPAPLAAIYVTAPATTEGALAGTELPELEVRVFALRAATSLSDWLATAGVTDEQIPAQVGDQPAVEVCAATGDAPACSIYLMAGERVYQLRAVNADGEAMRQSFVTLP